MRQQQRQQLSAFIERTQHGKASKRTSLELGPHDPSQHFTPQHHGMSPEMCTLANALLAKAQQQRPLHGTPQQQRLKFALRCAGIISAVRNHRTGSAHFGYQLHGYRGGRVMQMHGMHILKEIGPVGSLAARIARERKIAADFWERTGEVLPPGRKPAQSPEAQRIRDMIDLWETQQWQAQQDRLGW